MLLSCNVQETRICGYKDTKDCSYIEQRELIMPTLKCIQPSKYLDVHFYKHSEIHRLNEPHNIVTIITVAPTTLKINILLSFPLQTRLLICF